MKILLSVRSLPPPELLYCEKKNREQLVPPILQDYHGLLEKCMEYDNTSLSQYREGLITALDLTGTSCAARWLSPVTIHTSSPSRSRCLMTPLASGRRVSTSPKSPHTWPSIAATTTVRPLACGRCPRGRRRRGEGAGVDWWVSE